MKKILMIGLISGLCSTGVFAAACDGAGTNTAVAAPTTSNTDTGELCVCNGGSAAKTTVNGGSGAPVATPVFVKTGFDVQCSSNTIVSMQEVSNTLFAVGSGSVKGNQVFGGSSNGGSVSQVASVTCNGANKACTGGNVSSGLAAAVAAGSGSGG